MAIESEPNQKRISPSELAAVIEQARLEKWRELALIGPLEHWQLESEVPRDHTFYLREPLRDHHAPALAVLTELTGLDLSGNELGDDGARALSTLTGLTSLNLSDNWLGDDGARALSTLTGLTGLSLSGNKLGDEGARALSALSTLTSLDLSSNQLGTEGVRALAPLTRLTSLNLSFNQLGDDGARALPVFTWLTSLDLSFNELGDDGARALAAFTGLTALNVSFNQLGNDGARALAALTGLTSLDLSDNHLGADGARALAALTQLTFLDLSENQLGDDGARALAALTQLTFLDLSENQLGDDGARALAALTQLTSLDLSNNQLGDDGARALLEAWCGALIAASLRRLDLRGNRIKRSLLPREILESGDAQSILATYRRYRDAEAGLQPLNEAKVVVVGNEAVGKTSLIRYLVHGKSRDPDEKKTPGTAIHEKIEVSTWSVHQSQVRVNVWDFGGQEIMRGTHRFFLTERSLYLLVLEDRREDDRSIYEWLEIIAQRGGDSPVIIVVNKSDRDVPQRQLDEAVLRRDYPAIVGFARTSCNAGAAAEKTITALRAQISATLSNSERLRHVRDPIPRSWLRVKDAIANLARARSVLPVRDFERLCEGNPRMRASERITDPREQRALLMLLRDLGVVVTHGLPLDAPAARREITVLDPNWLTGAIYTLVNSITVREQGGKLRHDQLAEILPSTRYPERWHELILSMMQEPELGLCLPIAHGSGPRQYLLPDALPVNEPDYGVWPADALRFRFQYSLLPTGFIPRFIVEAHRSLTDKPTLWRTGVVLGAEGCRILVRSETARNRVEIQVAGKTGQRAALSIVRNYLAAVHSYYAKLSVHERVPLPEQPEVDVGYEHLVTLEREDGLDYTWRPEGAARKYSVRELLEGVRDTGVRDHRRREGIVPVRADLHGSRIAPRTVEPSTSPYRHQVDFGILTIREDENDAVLRRFAPVATEKRQRRYRIRRLALPDGESYTLAVLRCTEQGNTDAQAATRDLLEDLAPRFVLVVGIAGGAPSDDFSLGDVVVSSRIVDFSVEAVIRGKKREYALGGGPLHADAAKLAADVCAMVTDGQLDGWSSRDALKQKRPSAKLTSDRFYGTAAWKKSVRDQLRRHFAPTSRRPPRVVTGALASSDRLMKDDETLSVWLKIARQVVAVEMESAGIYKATQPRNIPFLAIRGISDVVGLRRASDWTAYACETAAAFTRAFLLTRPIDPIAPPAPTRRPRRAPPSR